MGRLTILIRLLSQHPAPPGSGRPITPAAAVPAVQPPNASAAHGSGAGARKPPRAAEAGQDGAAKNCPSW